MNKTKKIETFKLVEYAKIDSVRAVVCKKALKENEFGEKRKTSAERMENRRKQGG